MPPRDSAYDVAFLVSDEQLHGIRAPVGDDLGAATFAARFPELKTALIRFSDPTADVGIDDERRIVTQRRLGPVGLAASLPRFGARVSEPLRMRAGRDKPIRRQAALRVGAMTPATLVTNVALAAQAMLARQGKE
jgi:hypothetical protein